MIRVLLIDDHALVRAGLARLIASDAELEVVGQAGDGSTGATLARELKPDVALVDLAMPGMDGIETTRRVLRALRAHAGRRADRVQRPRRRCSARSTPARAATCSRTPSRTSCCAASAPPRAASPRWTRAPPTPSSPAQTEVGATLTAREREVLKLVAEGLPNKQIARALGITEKTVKAHMTKIFAAIGVTDRTAAALWAHRNGVR